MSHVRSSIANGIKLIRNYDFWYGFSRMTLSFVPRRWRDEIRICKKMRSKCDGYAMDYLRKRYGHVVGNYSCEPQKAIIGEKGNIWVFWWQGIEQAPPIVKICIGSIRRNAGIHKVILLDQKNYLKYVRMPEHIMEKFEAGQITITHFSDILRAELLYQYGGIWMDATVYMRKPLAQDVWNLQFFSIKHSAPCGGTPILWWTGFLIGGGRNNLIFGLLRELYYEYWKGESQLIVYLLMDFFLTMIYESVGEAKQLIDGLPISNQDIFRLAENLNSDEDFLYGLKEDTYLYKLTYKMKFVSETNGKKTVYGKLCEELSEDAEL